MEWNIITLSASDCVSDMVTMYVAQVRREGGLFCSLANIKCHEGTAHVRRCWRSKIGIGGCGVTCRATLDDSALPVSTDQPAG